MFLLLEHFKCDKKQINNCGAPKFSSTQNLSEIAPCKFFWEKGEHAGDHLASISEHKMRDSVKID